ncbi:MAG: hypothetical protein KDA75_22035, partial [Planctomycetaceae bacterium]|nr:hypothetical protein [Planctomycetaceae bacterium]
ALPKVDRTLPVDGPALGGPKLAQADADSPPFLEVIGARQLPSGPAAVETPTKKRRGLLWGIGAMVVVLLGAAFAFRRRWSAGAAVKK